MREVKFCEHCGKKLEKIKSGKFDTFNGKEIMALQCPSIEEIGLMKKESQDRYEKVSNKNKEWNKSKKWWQTRRDTNFAIGDLIITQSLLCDLEISKHTYILLIKRFS